MIYEFRDNRTGAIVEADYPMEQAPSIGAVVRIGGRDCTRIASNFGGSEQVANATWGWPRKPVQGPQDIPGWKHRDPRDGRIIIPSRTAEREYLAATNRERDW